MTAGPLDEIQTYGLKNKEPLLGFESRMSCKGQGGGNTRPTPKHANEAHCTAEYTMNSNLIALIFLIVGSFTQCSGWLTFLAQIDGAKIGAQQRGLHTQSHYLVSRKGLARRCQCQVTRRANQHPSTYKWIGTGSDDCYNR